ncbi:MAG: tetratricopeptide repeat protein [Planctomycetales bacterium]|nr:tetratricopeptide repeat protein [Planctomycetales bacterium]
MEARPKLATKTRVARFARCTVAVTWGVCQLFVAGCSSLSPNPVADNVVSARQMSMRGLDALHRGRWDEAETDFAAAVQACPVDERAHQHYAETLWHRGARAEALEHMRTAIKLSGQDPNLLVRIGQMHLALDELGPASQYAEAALQRNRQLPDAWALRGDVASRSRAWDEALASYHRALNLHENMPAVQRAVAEIYLTQGNAHRALATVQAAAAAYPSDQTPVELLTIEGVALKSLGQFDAAVARLTAAAERGTPSDELLYQLGHARLLAGDPANARLALNEALKLNPRHPASVQLRDEIDEASQQMATLQR